MQVIYSHDCGWWFTKRIVNLRSFTIDYVQTDGYETIEETEKEKQKTSMFISNTETATKMLGIWTVQHLIIILPSIQQSFRLSGVSYFRKSGNKV